MQTNTKETKPQFYTAGLLLALTLLMAIRLLPMLKAPISAYGYDFGFYLSAAKTAAWHFKDLGQSLWGGYNSPWFVLANLIHLPASVSLVGSYFFMAVFSGWSIYYLMLGYDKLTGIFAVSLVALSQIQMESYFMFLWKNAMALPFLFLGFTLLENAVNETNNKNQTLPEQQKSDKSSISSLTGFGFLRKKNWWGFASSSLLILLLHRTTAIIYFLTLGLYLIWAQIKSKSYKTLIAIILGACLLLAACYLLFPIKSIISNLINNNNYYVSTGLFLQGQDLFSLWWPTAFLALAGLIIYLKRKQQPLLPIFTGLCLVWLAFKLPFYRRILIYLDLAVICFAAYFLGQINYARKGMKIALCIIFIFLIYRQVTFILAKTPLIYQPEIAEIQNFNQPPGFLLAVSADDAPWLLAYSKNQRLGAPGLLEDPHTYNEWQDFWQGQNQRQFLSYYPRPLYFYERSWRLPQVGTALCLIPISPNFFQMDYKCLEKTSQ